jgi:hypothetical protein
MTINRHEPFEELISASLTGDLSATERQRLDAHLDACPECRATLAAFGDQRRIIAGLRHVVPPRDLAARVRTGIEGGRFADRPWWQRPAIVFAGAVGGLAAATGALLAFVIMNVGPSSPQTGDSTPTLSAAAMASDAPASVAPIGSLPPSGPPTESTVATPHPTPPGSIGWGAINYLQWEGTLADQSLSLRGWDPATQASAHLLDLDVDGEPVAAIFSPDSNWLAYQVPIGLKGTNRVVAVHLMSGTSFELGETPDGSPFSTRMTWSPDSRLLAYTAADVAAGVGPDAWAFDTASESAEQLTDSGTTYAASFVPTGDGAGTLWISQAGPTPVSYPLATNAFPSGGPVDPATLGGAAEQVFQPIVSPGGEHAIFWRGTMRETGGAWTIDRGGMLYLSGEPVDGAPSWSGEPLFSSLTVGQDALGSARVAWSYDADWFAVWNVEWRGVPQEGPSGAFPDATDVYLGRAIGRDLIDGGRDAVRLIDPESDDWPIDATFVALDVDGDGRAIAVTIIEAPEGESGSSPVAESRLVLRPLAAGDADLAEIGPAAQWVGPALYVPQGDEGR